MKKDGVCGLGMDYCHAIVFLVINDSAWTYNIASISTTVDSIVIVCCVPKYFESV